MNRDAESAAAEPVDPDVEPEDLPGRPPRAVRAGHTGPVRPTGRSGGAARWQQWRTQAPVVAVIAAGGAAGTLARYEAGLIWPTPTGHFPWTTFLINAIGCLVIGVFLVLVTEFRSGHRLLRPFFGTGILGGFTTFSTFCVDTERLVDTGRAPLALAYLAGTALAALCAVTAGAWSARSLLRKWSAS